MLPLTKVSHEHHDLLWRVVNQLNDLADCLSSDCLDSGWLIAELPQLREIHDGLTTRLLPHMDAVEAAVWPTLERLADRGTTLPMADEHEEIRCLVTKLGSFLGDSPAREPDRIAALGLRRVLLRLYVLLKAHLSEEELYVPILEDRLTPAQEQALARALDHLTTQRV
jgi:hypothetical protein